MLKQLGSVLQVPVGLVSVYVIIDLLTECSLIRARRFHLGFAPPSTPLRS